MIMDENTDEILGCVWKCNNNYNSKCFFIRNVFKIIFFYFFKINFNISIIKQFKIKQFEPRFKACYPTVKLFDIIQFVSVSGSFAPQGLSVTAEIKRKKLIRSLID
jgi:hypothetical protein